MTLNDKLNLDVDSPSKVPDVLREAVETFVESSLVLDDAWQDKGAGRTWRELAKILERAAEQADKALAKSVISNVPTRRPPA